MNQTVGKRSKPGGPAFDKCCEHLVFSQNKKESNSYDLTALKLKKKKEYVTLIQ